MKTFILLLNIVFLSVFSGCGPAIIGGAATETYRISTDKRSVGRMWDDASITSQIKINLLKDKYIKSNQIDVDTLDSIVYLNGVVNNKIAYNRAQKIVKQVPGVKSVYNNLQIGHKTIGQSIDDQVIWSKIKTALIKEPGIRSLNIDVDVNKGVVTLIAIIEEQKQRNKIIQIARTTQGVVKVINNLQLTQKQ